MPLAPAEALILAALAVLAWSTLAFLVRSGR